MKKPLDEGSILSAPIFKKIENPKKYFTENKGKFNETVEVIRRSFGTEITEEDCFLHLTFPSSVYLVEFNGEIGGMASYSRKNFLRLNALIVEGIAIDSFFQGKEIFKKVTNGEIFSDEKIICLRTQNPLMYRALENYCKGNVFPKNGNCSEILCAIRDEYSCQIGCSLDEKGVARSFYGKCLYNPMPIHKDITKFFEHELGMIPENGDALLMVGVR